MIRLVFLALLSVSVVRYSSSVSVLRPCNMMCMIGKVCRQVYDAQRGDVQAQCVTPPPVFTPEGVCTVGEPLLQATPTGVKYAFCGRGPSRIVCPVGYRCIIDPVDRYAVCCADIERPGNCPAPSGLAGICVFDPSINCLQDSECAVGQKCCSEGCGKVCKPV